MKKNKRKVELKQRIDFILSFSHHAKHILSTMQTRVHAVKKEAGKRELPSLPLLEWEFNRFKAKFGNILDTEKIQKGKKLYKHNTVINISKLLTSMIYLYKDIAADKNIQITWEIERDLSIRMSQQAFERILWTIIDNAIKYNKENGQIHIIVKGDDNSVHLVVKDTGTGIPDDRKQDLFKPYFEITRKTDQKADGSGGGLYIVRSILNDVAGEITIKSQMNKGTTVSITFKRVKSKKKKEDKLSKQLDQEFFLKTEEWEQGKKTILFVDNDMTLVSMMQNEMADEYNFYYAFNGRNALDKLVTIHKPDIIISGIVMEPVDGYEFLKELRENKGMEDIPFVFLSVKTGPSEIIKGLQHGAVDYIEKPFNMELFKEKIRTLLHIRENFIKKEMERMERRISEAIRTRDLAIFKFNRNITKYNISAQERKVIQYLIKGFNISEIAEKLSLSHHTVRNHIRHIYVKCKVDNRARLMCLFLE